MKKNIVRLVIEVGFIMILFYANLVMSEYVQGGPGFKKGLEWSVFNVFTLTNLAIAVVAGCAGYVVVEYLRRNLASGKR